MSRFLSADSCAKILSLSRSEKGKSQKYMAKALGKSVGTIQNWEAGVGSPNLLDFVEWFNVLGTNPLRYVLDFVHPETYDGLAPDSSTDMVRSALLNYLQHDASDDEVRKLAFCIFGDTGSSWHSQLEMICAHNHAPLKSRIPVASAIATNFVLANELGEIVCPDNIMPDIGYLKDAIDRAIVSVSQKKNGYTNIKGGT